MAELAASRELKVRVAVAKHRRATVEVLRVLSLDGEAEVRRAVHRNKSASDEIPSPCRVPMGVGGAPAP
jgi:hypothetical protein